jgi:hypothetical protein
MVLQYDLQSSTSHRASGKFIPRMGTRQDNLPSSILLVKLIPLTFSRRKCVMALISVGSGTPSCLVSWTLSRLHSWKLITPVNFLAPILLRRPLPGSHLPPVHLLIFPLLRLIPSVTWALWCLTYAAPDVSLFVDANSMLSPH